MTWRWLIFFSLCCSAAARAATLTGQVELVNSLDPGVRKHKLYSGVVVWLQPVDRSPELPSGRTAVMAQKGKQFVPHVLAVTVGTKVEFPNFDPIFHNAFSNFSGQKFDTGLYPPNTAESVQFRRDGIVRVFCNIHSTMSAVIVVLRTPYFAVTSREGRFEIPNVPPGEYDLRVFHERSTEATLKALQRRIVIENAGNGGTPSVVLPVLRISEQGYLEVPHRNKYDHEYPPESPRGAYPGGPA